MGKSSGCGKCAKPCGDCASKPKPRKPQVMNMKLMKKAMKIKKMLFETQDHDRNTCDCKACWHYNMGWTITQNSRFHFVIEGWKKLDRDEYIRTFQRIMNYRIDKLSDTKALKRFLKSKNAPPKKIPEIAKNMQAPMFVFILGPSPSKMGMLREI